jgi:hypothetical protein
LELNLSCCDTHIKMSLRKYRLLIVVAFLGIFSAKMVISAAPVFFAHLDKETIKNVIMQIELEHGSEGDSGKVLKYVDCKFIDLHAPFSYVPVRYHFFIKNSYIDHFKRYVNPYHPSVPTPPPNLA